MKEYTWAELADMNDKQLARVFDETVDALTKQQTAMNIKRQQILSIQGQIRDLQGTSIISFEEEKKA